MKRWLESVGASVADGFRDERGFTTIGTLLALLISLSLLFSAAQVQRITSVSAQVQDVADAAALAAQNEVAEFMVVVRVCDAVVLTMSLTGLTAMGLGVAALCTPFTAPASSPLIEAGKSVLNARDAFSERASQGLAALQEALPFLSAANAMLVAQAYNGGSLDASYIAVALPFPDRGEDIVEGTSGDVRSFADDVARKADGIREASERAEALAEEAAEIKEHAFRRDCGDSPGYCMRERAAVLAGLTGSENPLYRNVDNWSFSVALQRARTYYSARLNQEAPSGDTVEQRAESALRKRFYQFAVNELADAYVHEDAGSFEASLPRFPRNSNEVRMSSLYTEEVYPVTEGDDGVVMHAWPGCPGVTGRQSFGSVAQMESGGYMRCSYCEFSVASLGSVAAASTSIENGFEYHYDAVAVAAAEYQSAMERLQPEAQKVKDEAGRLFQEAGDLMGSAGDVRIDATPPGRYGTVVLVAALSEMPASAGFPSTFVSSGGSLGTRAAVSAATLIEDESDDEGDMISSLLDGLDCGIAAGPAGIVLDCWSALLRVYADGQQALDRAISESLDALPFGGASGLGAWASDALVEATSAVGLQPADLDALKPILLNSAHVAGKGESQFGARLISLKTEAIAHPSSSTDFISSAIGAMETSAIQRVEELADGMDLAEVQFFDGGPTFTVRLALPPVAVEGIEGLVERAIDVVRDVAATVTGVRPWE